MTEEKVFIFYHSVGFVFIDEVKCFDEIRGACQSGFFSDFTSSSIDRYFPPTNFSSRKSLLPKEWMFFSCVQEIFSTSIAFARYYDNCAYFLKLMRCVAMRIFRVRILFTCCGKRVLCLAFMKQSGFD